MESDLLEHRDACRHCHVAEADARPLPFRLLLDLVYPDLGGLDGLRVIVEVPLLDRGDLLLQVELLHKVRVAPVEVDGVVV